MKVYRIGRNTTMKVLDSIQGIEKRTNTVIHSPPQARGDKSTEDHVVYFPGDIQDFQDVMLQSSLSREYVDWSYEATITNLSSRFPHSNLWLISPSKRTYQTICVYKNFVKIESVLGIPSHSTDFEGLHHLELLLSNAFEHLGIATSSCSQITLIGFSKGCVVFNQFLYELSAHDHNNLKHSESFIKQLTAMVWLDGGHSGEEEVWVTDPLIIAALDCPLLQRINYFIHVTPYQVLDKHRPWKGEAKEQFVELLRQHKLNFRDELYFGDEAATILTHFKILNYFKNFADPQ